MPACPHLFRARCGCFTPVFVNFMLKRAKEKRLSRVKRVVPGTMFRSVVLVFVTATLLLQCGDIEVNPGPGPLSQQRKQLAAESLLLVHGYVAVLVVTQQTTWMCQRQSTHLLPTR
ncbi:hypothetical protein BaRGS_00025972 [Batillaria attramentaria]|uniref:Uncharacterized protein n=1 Tax=Batillaria attramentaria TaxID=370345 RepID=A0ABD0K7F6_9CAEN